MSSLLNDILLEIELNGGVVAFTRLILKENPECVSQRENHRHLQVYKKNRKNWTTGELKLLMELKDCGYDYPTIGYILTRTRFAIRDKYRSLVKELV